MHSVQPHSHSYHNERLNKLSQLPALATYTINPKQTVHEQTKSYNILYNITNIRVRHQNTKKKKMTIKHFSIFNYARDEREQTEPEKINV